MIGDPTTAILDLVRERGPMTWEQMGAPFIPYVPGGPPVYPLGWVASRDRLLASGALREVEWREKCLRCRGGGKASDGPGAQDVGMMFRPCSSCNGSGTVPVTYIATREQASVMEALREGPMEESDLRMKAWWSPHAGRLLVEDWEAFLDALLAANWITRTEQERECGTCGGAEIDEDGDIPCPDCKDGKQTVVAYELVERVPD